MPDANNRNGAGLAGDLDPRRAVLQRWQQAYDMTSNSVERRAESPPRWQPAPPPTAITLRRPSPPPTNRDVTSAAQRRQAATREAYINGRAVHTATGLQHSAIRTSNEGRGRTNGYTASATDHERKGSDPENEWEDPRKGQRLRENPVRVHRETTSSVESYNTQRERLLRMQARFAAMQQVPRPHAQHPAGYYEFASPVRPHESATAPARTPVAAEASDDQPRSVGRGNQRGAPRLQPHQRTTRRPAPEEIMDEFDDNLWRSFNERQHPSMAISRDASELPDDEEEEDDSEDVPPPPPSRHQQQSNGHARAHQSQRQPSPPPVMPVRVSVFPPFREEISHSRSMSEEDEENEMSRTLDDDGNPYVSQYTPTSEDLGVHFPASSDIETIPSISLTPPASPAHGRARPTPEIDTRLALTAVAPHIPSPRRFSAMNRAFIVACVLAGICGFYIEELLDFVSPLFTSASLAVSRSEQREMQRRLDLLQRELGGFKKAATEIESQSQRMVQEVRVHLEKMKQERQRHQQMISDEMVALRAYVHDVTNELVEEEKKEIHKRLMDTIAGTTAAAGDESISTPDQVSVEKPTVSVVEVDVDALAELEAKRLTEGAVDHSAVMQQIDRAIASAAKPLVRSPTAEINATQATSSVSTATSSSLLSLEWVLLLTGVAIVAGVVGNRVRIANRRSKRRVRRPWQFMQARPAAKQDTGGSGGSAGDESEVETVDFIRGSSEADPDEVDEDSASEEFAEDEDDEVQSSVYSEDEETKEDVDGVYDPTAFSASLSSEPGEYDFQPAQFSEDIEPLDETPSSPGPSPLPTRKSQLPDHVTDDADSVRRSPRIQSRSHLAYMR